MSLDWTLALALVAVACFAAGAGLLTVFAVSVRNPAHQSSIFAETGTGAVFLYDGDVLIDSTPGARALLSSSQVRGGPWLRLLAYLVPHFPDIEAQLLRLPAEGAITLVSAPDAPDAIFIQVELRGGLTRIAVSDSERFNHAAASDPMAQRALQDELEKLRETISRAPILTWRENGANEVIWANAGYLARATALLGPGQDLSWPLPRLFGRTASSQGIAGQRQSLSLPGQPTAWYDLVSTAEGEGRLLFAMSADASVQAETALRDFMQTLTKTFAQLPIGLAIFDQQRQLQLFNPALLDLTGLPVDFLSLRPSLLSVLDAMRDRNMIPEPKDYRSWRRQLVEMEKAAASGLYEETWNLPDGQTYRVVGRPHPNGALALMIEDISNEMLRTRRYRADLELGQAVVDEMDEAIAVFTQTGQMVMSNAAYALLWHHDPAATLEESTVRTLSTHWRSQSAPSAVWAEIEDFVSTVGDRQPWQAEARLLDGRLIACRFVPLVGGSTMALFRLSPVAEAAQPRLADSSERRSA